MPKESDSSLIESWIQDAQEGSAEAFDSLARHFLPRIRRWALVRTGDPDDADDVVQRALVQAYRNIQNFRGTSPFAGWLYAITTNAGNELTRARTSKDRALDRLRVVRLSEADAPDARTPDSELADLVRTFFTELSPRQREMMDLVDFQGYKPAEAAEMLGLEQATARVHLLRARRRVRTLILQADPAMAEDLR